MNILAFFAHPDDETVFAGGALALLAGKGAQVHYLCATRGEGGETGEPPLCTQAELGEVREQELLCAVQALGGRSLTFLGYIDPRVGPEEELYPYTQDLTFLAGQVAATMRQFQADVLISHGSRGEYGHPAHLLTHRASRIAVESLYAEESDAAYAPVLHRLRQLPATPAATPGESRTTPPTWCWISPLPWMQKSRRCCATARRTPCSCGAARRRRAAN